MSKPSPSSLSGKSLASVSSGGYHTRPGGLLGKT